jgi:hypothetical protein
MTLVGFVALANPISADPTGTIEKSMSDTSPWLGDYVIITLDVTIAGGDLTVFDDLPEYLSYISGTFMVDGSPATPKCNGGVSITLGPGTYVITFKVIFDSGPAEDFWDVNTAYLMDGRCVIDEDSVDLFIRKYCSFNKYAENMRDEDGDGIIEVGENVIWDFRISVYNGLGYTMEDATVWDRFGAEIEVDVNPTVTHGTWDIKTKGKSDKVFLRWDIGDLDSGDSAILTMVISTDINPAGKQEYTSPGCYIMNSGAVLKFINPEGIQISAHTPSISVHVEPQN